MPGHQGENLYKIGPNKFMGGGGVCGRGEKGGAFCSVCIFHNQKMHVYLIYHGAGTVVLLLLLKFSTVWSNRVQVKRSNFEVLFPRSPDTKDDANIIWSL